MATRSSCDFDNTFGPWAGQCRGGFDFTLRFEEIILTILPCSLFCAAATLRILWLRRQKDSSKPAGGWLLYLKQILIGTIAIIDIAVLVLTALPKVQGREYAIAAQTLSLLSTLLLLSTSWLEHRYSSAPSTVNLTFLLVITLCNAARIRTAWLLSNGRTIASLLSAQLAQILVLLILESLHKSRWFDAKTHIVSAEEQSSVFGKALLLWMNKILWQGAHRDLIVSDLASFSSECEIKERHTSFETEWQDSGNTTKKHALLRCLFSQSISPILMPVAPRIGMIAVTLAQPLLLRQLLAYIADKSASWSLGYGLIGAFALLYIVTALCNAAYAHTANRLVVTLREVLIPAIYGRVFAVKAHGLEEGHLVTIVNVDLEHIVQAGLLLHEIWASIATVGIAYYMLYRFIGTAFLGPLCSAVVLSFAGSLLGGSLGNAQVAWLETTAERTAASMTLIDNVNEIKAMGLSVAFQTFVMTLRKDELNLASKMRRLLALFIVISAASSQLAILSAYAGFSIISRIRGIDLDVETLFTSLAILQISTDPLYLLIQGYPQLVAAYACLGRIQDFLSSGNDTISLKIGSVTGSSAASLSETSSHKNSSVRSTNEKTFMVRESSIEKLVDIAHATFSVTSQDEEINLLQQLSLTSYRGSSTAIIGSVGSGKTSILQAVLGELNLESGSRWLAPGIRIAYSAQDPWLFDGTIRDNVLGDRDLDASWYEKVLEATCLVADLAAFAAGDQEHVKLGGSSLSGGQRHRVSLARALYSRPDLLLLDDVFSGLDKCTAASILSNVFGSEGILSSLRCGTILGTNSVFQLKDFDEIFTVEKGFAVKTSAEKLACGFDRDEQMENVQTVRKNDAGMEHAPKMSSDSPTTNNDDEPTLKSSDFKVYTYFLSSLGWKWVVIFFILAAILSGEQVYQSVWLKTWAEASNAQDVTFYISIFTGLVLAGLCLLFLLCWFFFDVILSPALLSIYQDQMRTLLRAPLRTILSLGKATLANRFVQDIMLLDNDLPMNFLNTCTAFFACCGETIIIFLASKYLSISLPILLGLLYCIQKFYLRTSKQLRLLDIESKAPLTAHVSETVKAIVSIRAFGNIDRYQSKLILLLRKSQDALYTFYSVQVWLKMVLDFVVAALAVFVVALAVGLRDNQSIGFLGLALVNLISLGASFKYLITFWTELEQAIGSVARVRAFNTTTESEPCGSAVVPSQWPSTGRIEVRGLTVAYGAHLSPVLDQVSISIAPGSKIGLCGRSGTGKSSLLFALLRCLDIRAGAIEIDGHDTSAFDPNDVRSRITLLTQKPVLVPGTLRDNITLYGALPISDEAACAALQQVGLWDKFIQADKEDEQEQTSTMREISVSALLDRDVDLEHLLSHGQRQLFCIARIVAQGASGNTIVLLDEITSNVDEETEGMISTILNVALADKTVIEVAHRLDRLAGYDAVYEVRDKGLHLVS